MKKAFTVIELIIAILIFGTGIIAVLQLLLFDIDVGQKVELKTMSTIVAKEGMELMYNLRDTNNINYKKWSELSYEEYFESGKYYKISHNLTGGDTATIDIQEYLTVPEFEDVQLYYHTWDIYEPTYGDVWTGAFWYNHEENENPTFYARYIEISDAYLEPEMSIDGGEQIYKIRSVGLYKKGWKQWEVVLESFISNWK